MNNHLLNELQDISGKAEVLFSAGQILQAENLYKSSVEKAKTVCGAKSGEYALSLAVLAIFHINAKQYPEAYSLFEEAFPIIENVDENVIWHKLTTIKNYLFVCKELGYLERIERLFEYVAELFKKIKKIDFEENFAHANSVIVDFGESSLDKAIILYDALATCLKNQLSRELTVVAIQKMDLLIQSSRSNETGELFNKTIGYYIENTEFVGDIQRLATIGLQIEKYREVSQLINILTVTKHSAVNLDCRYWNYEGLKLAVELARKLNANDVLQKCTELLDFAIANFGEENPKTTIAQFYYGRELYQGNKFQEAIIYLQPALTGLFSAQKKEYDVLAECYYVLGFCYDKQADYPMAQSCYENSYFLYERLYSEHYWKTIRSCYSVGEICRMRLDYPNAVVWLDKARINEIKTHGNSGFAAQINNNLGEVFACIGEFGKADLFIREALVIRELRYGKSSPEFVRSSLALINLLQRQNKFTESAQLVNQLEPFITNEQISNEQHFSFILSKAISANLNGKTEYGISLLKEIIESGSQLSPADNASIFFQLGYFYLIMEDFSASTEYITRALDIFIILILDDLTNSTGQSRKAKIEDVRYHMQLLLAVLVKNETSDQSTLGLVYKFLQQVRSLETRLVRLLKPSFLLGDIDEDSEKKRTIYGLFDSQQELKENKIAQSLNDIRAGNSIGGELIAIEQSIEANERAISSYLGTVAREREILIMSRILTVPKDTAIVEYYFIEDANIYVAFVLLPDKRILFHNLGDCENINYVVKRLHFEINYPSDSSASRYAKWASSSKFLSGKLIRPFFDEVANIKKLVVVPDGVLGTLPFELLIENNKLAQDIWIISYSNYGSESSTYKNFWGSQYPPTTPIVIADIDLGTPPHQTFPELPYSLFEGNLVNSKIQGSLLTSQDVSKRVLLGSRAPEIIHIASHSFYLPYKQDHLSTPPTFTDLISQLHEPLDRTGIAMANINYSIENQSGEAGNILFGSEIIDWDLRGTDLVVLSSCQSGLGDMEIGDGLQGLKKAFKAAGAKSIVSSLWRVSDEITCLLMEHFYDELLKGVPKAIALKNAKDFIRIQYDDDPFYWASFTIDGNPEPLGRFDWFSRVTSTSH